MAEKMGKSQFSVTCSLLSQYLREKGSFRGIDLQMAPSPVHHQPPKDNPKAPTTLSLLPGVQVSAEDNIDQNTPKSMALFPQQAGFDSPAKEELIEAPSNIMDTEKAQLTIFYGGKVLTFDDFPAEKAMDLMKMAGKESNSTQKLGSSAPASSMVADCPTKPTIIFASPTVSENLPKPAPARASDMPIARRNSLHRFLEKRKDRINTNAPYQVHGGSAMPDAAKPDDRQHWLGLGREAVTQEYDCESSR